jgi:hypothetical protein
MKIRLTACSIQGKLLLSLFFLLFSLTIFGQTKTVTGTIRDDKGQPLAGATVTVKGSPGGTSTDANGNFSISAPENANPAAYYYPAGTAALASSYNVTEERLLFPLPFAETQLNTKLGQNPGY